MQPEKKDAAQTAETLADLTRATAIAQLSAVYAAMGFAGPLPVERTESGVRVVIGVGEGQRHG